MSNLEKYKDNTKPPRHQEKTKQRHKETKIAFSSTTIYITFLLFSFPISLLHIYFHSLISHHQNKMAMAPMEENVVKSNLEKLFSMKGGKGEASYANNSQAQVNHSYSFPSIFSKKNVSVVFVSVSYFR